MKYEILIHKDPLYAEVVGHGKAEAQDFMQITTELVSHKDFVSGINFLHDYRDIQTGHLTLDEVRRIAVSVGSHHEVLGNGRWALLVSSDINFGMGRMWEALVSGKATLEVRIYRDESAALDWIKGS